MDRQPMSRRTGSKEFITLAAMIGLLIASGDPLFSSDVPAQNENEIARFAIERLGPILASATAFGKPMQFLLDTGASKTILDKSTFQSLLGKPSTTMTMNAISSVVEVPLHHCPQIQVEGVFLFDAMDFSIKPEDRGLIGCMDLGHLQEASGEKLEGILGNDFLRSKVLLLDYEAEFGAFLKQSTNPQADSERLQLAKDGCPTIRLQIGSEGFHSFIVDTGSTRSLTITPDVFGRLLRTKQVILWSSSLVAGLGGVVKYRRGVLNQIAIGSLTLRNVTIEEAPLNTVGLAFFERFKTEFDFPNKKVFVRPNRFFHVPELRSLAGFRIKRVGVELRIFDVDESVVAADIQNDDLLMKVNGRPVGEFSLAKIRLLGMQADTELKLTLQRGGLTKEVSCQLKRPADPFPNEATDQKTVPFDE